MSFVVFSCALVAGVLTLHLPDVHGATVDQPAPFSHKHHVAELGLDCRDCHQTVDISAYAGMPNSDKCTGCHSQLVTPQDDAPVRNASASTQADYHLREFVNFDHSVHAAKGVACASCHGDVERAGTRMQASNLTTGWCVDCHRHPERFAGAPAAHAIGTLPFATLADLLLTDH